MCAAFLVFAPLAAIAQLGLHKLLRGNTVSIEELDANYIRRSDAEIFSLPKIASHGKQTDRC